MAIASDEFKIPKLSTDNYHAWAIRSRAAMVQKNCWEAVDPGFGPEMSHNERKINEKALTFLFLIVEDDYLDDIGTCERAKEAWEILKDIHSKFGLLHVLQMMKDLFTIKKQKGEAMKDYLGRIVDINRKLTNGGYNLGDREMSLIMLMGLPRSYEQLILKLEQDEEDLTTKLVKARLLVEEKRHLRRETEEDDETQKGESHALFVKNREKPNFSGNVKMKKPENVNKLRCVRCFCCGKMGHIARNCKKAYADDSEEIKNPKSDRKTSTSMTMYTALCVTKAKDDEEKCVWYLDSGATDHMTCCKEKFIQFGPLTGKVKTANNEKMDVAGVGKIEMKLSDQNGGSKISLSRVLYVPTLSGNLLSVGRLEEKGMTVIVQNGELKATNEEGIQVFWTKRTNGMYPIREEEEYEAKLTSNGREVEEILIEEEKEVHKEKEEHEAKLPMSQTEDLWHRRLGHLHVKAVNKIAEKFEMTFDKEIGSVKENCDICLKAKMTRSPFNKSGRMGTKAPLDLIHTDVVGPITPTSKGGSRYLVTFIDDYSRYTKVYPISKKSDVFEKFIEYKKLVENFQNRKIKAILSDNGGEYDNKKFEEYLKKKGIQRRFTVPRTPQQNGIAERMNRTLLDMTRCLLMESGIPKNFWGDAVNTACYIRNKCPSRALDSKIPEELWTGSSPAIKDLRTFGCQVWAAYTKEAKAKLDERARECVLIGYPEGIKGYKLWDFNSDKIFVSRDVKFEEDIYPMKKTQPTEARKNEKSNEEMIISLGHRNESNVTDVSDEGKKKTVGLFEREDDVNYDDDRTQRELTENIPTRRYSLRQAENREYQLQCNTSSLNNIEENPETVDQAMNSACKEQWKAAMEEELANLNSKNTWELVEKPEDRNIVGCKWVFCKKINEKGEVIRFKARLVAQGYSQMYGIDYTETFSPVVKIKTIRILLALAVELNWKTRHLDIVAAYLNEKLEE